MYAVFLYGKTTAAKNLRVLFQGIKFQKPSGANFPILLGLKFVNPSSSPIKINSIVGDLFINGHLFNTVTQTNSITIPGNDTVTRTVRIETGLLQAISTVAQLIREKKKFTVTFKGVANSTGFMIPIEQTLIQS